MKTYYYFNKNDDPQFAFTIRTQGYQNEYGGKTTYELLELIDDVFELNEKTFIYDLDKEQRERFYNYNFRSGKYAVEVINELDSQQNYKSIFLKELTIHDINIKDILVLDSKILIGNTIYTIIEVKYSESNTNKSLPCFVLKDNRDNNIVRSHLDLIASDSKLIL